MAGTAAGQRSQSSVAVRSTTTTSEERPSWRAQRDAVGGGKTRECELFALRVLVAGNEVAWEQLWNPSRSLKSEPAYLRFACQGKSHAQLPWSVLASALPCCRCRSTHPEDAVWMRRCIDPMTSCCCHVVDKPEVVVLPVAVELRVPTHVCKAERCCKKNAACTSSGARRAPLLVHLAYWHAAVHPLRGSQT
eukprot:366299-Chlamydomonas_euryale.AAC.1